MLSKFLQMVVVALALVVLVAPAEARVGGGGSFGSRGSRTFSMPNSTSTAPGRAAPIQRNYENNGQANPANQSIFRPGARTNGGGFLGGSFGKGLLGGFLGAGLFGLLSGHGFLGGIGSLFGFIGLLVQLAIVFFVAKWLFGLFRGNTYKPAAAGPMGGMGPMGGTGNSGFRPDFQPAGGGSQNGAQTSSVPLTLQNADFAFFEQRLEEIQTAFSNEDVAGLQRLATAEMVRHFSSELADNAQRGVVNKVSQVRLLQGDLSEGWRDQDGEYATVAMRYTLIDTTFDKASHRLVGGSESQAVEVRELWTFVRPVNGSTAQWLLSAIQQTS